MKSIVNYLLLAILLYSCSITPREQAMAMVEEYNDELEEFAADSTTKTDTAAVNDEYQKLHLPAISETTMIDISNEAVFKELLRTEKELLSKFEPVQNFKSYTDIKSDTPLKLIRGCASFDRAPRNAERLPSNRGMRTISLEYYKYEVPVAFHIIVNGKGEGLQGSMIHRINNQINILNNVYGQFNIKFTLHSIDTTRNDTWFTQASYYTNQTALDQMTSSLSTNPAKVMNVYTLGSQVLGEATFPWYDSRGTSRDYIVINYNTLAGGPNTFFNGFYNEGKTLVHEAGHFLGLLHTFEGGTDRCHTELNDGCTIGDQVEDTPWQKVCYMDGCKGDADSCPAPGNDPVNNYMGYNPDGCMNSITPGQGERLKQCIIYFRYYLVANPI